MGWRRIKDRLLSTNTQPDTASAPVVERPLTIAPPIRRRTPEDRGTEQRLADLHRRRDALVYDIEQGMLAQQPANPWAERIALLTETLANVRNDMDAIDARPRIQRPTVDPIKIMSIQSVVTDNDLYVVSFTIADESFRFEEQVDWDERGGPRVRGDLQQVAGNADRLVPATFSDDDATAFAEHLRHSIVVFATDLRDCALAGDPDMPTPTLADLAQPCPTCGGWTEWGGRCPECAARERERHVLLAESNRLEDERRSEADEQHRLSDGLPISQRRLAAVEADIRTLEATQS